MTTDVVIAAIAGAIVAILSTEVVKRLLTAEVDRETTAQAAIISLAQEAIGGWRQESTAVVQLTDLLRAHDQSQATRYDDLKSCAEKQEERLRSIQDRIVSLVTILGGQPTTKVDQSISRK